MIATQGKVGRMAQYVVMIFVLAAYASLQVWRPLTGLHSNDFKHIYLGMQAIWEGRDPYGAASLLNVARDHGLSNASLNPFVYLPFTGMVLGFLKPFTFASAALLWFAINHVLLLATLALWSSVLVKTVNYQVSKILVFTVLLLCAVISHPLSRTLTAGQLNLVLMFCYAWAFGLMVRGRDFTAGSVLGFAALFKIAPGFFLIHWLVTRRWRAFWAMVATCAVLLLCSVAIAGLRVHLDFLPMLRQMGYGRSTWEEYGATFWKDPWNQSINSLFTHLFVSGNRVTLSWWEGTQAFANILTWATSLALLGIYGAVAWKLASRQAATAQGVGLDAPSQALSMAALLLSLLLPSLLWDHYLVILILPATWLVAIAWSRRWWGVVAISVACYLVTAAPVRFDSELFRVGWGVLFMSAKLFPTLILFGVCLYASRRLKTCLLPAAERSLVEL